MEEMGQGKINPVFWSTKLVHGIYNGRKIPINSCIRTLWIKLETQLSYETAEFNKREVKLSSNLFLMYSRDTSRLMKL